MGASANSPTAKRLFPQQSRTLRIRRVNRLARMLVEGLDMVSARDDGLIRTGSMPEARRTVDTKGPWAARAVVLVPAGDEGVTGVTIVRAAACARCSLVPVWRSAIAR